MFDQCALTKIVGVGVEIGTVVVTMSASSADLKRIQTPHTLFRDFRAVLLFYPLS